VNKLGEYVSRGGTFSGLVRRLEWGLRETRREMKVEAGESRTDFYPYPASPRNHPSAKSRRGPHRNCLCWGRGSFGSRGSSVPTVRQGQQRLPLRQTALRGAKMIGHRLIPLSSLRRQNSIRDFFPPYRSRAWVKAWEPADTTVQGVLVDQGRGDTMAQSYDKDSTSERHSSPRERISQPTPRMT
jgi:hypothetical protein